MFGLIEKVFITAIEFIELNSYNAMKCLSTSNQEYIIRPTVVDININEPLFYSYSVT